MAKTYYLGHTKSGTPVGRASKEDYGYAFAAYHPSRRGIPCFSTTAEGARRNIGKGWVNVEIVEIHRVSAKAYREAMGKS